MRVGVIDVASDGVALLVAAPNGRGLLPVREERAVLGRDERVGTTAEVVDAYARVARELAVAFLQVVVQPAAVERAGHFVRAVGAAGRAPVRVLTPDDEARLVWDGAVASAGALPETVAVCDVGARTTTLVVGTVPGTPVWIRHVDVGAATLADRYELDSPDARDAAAARAEVERRFDGLLAPLPKAALATPLDASTLAGGALILAEVQRRLGVRVRVAQGGLREGAALALLEQLAAA